MSTKDFWDELVRPLGYTYWDWGVTADWVSGLGTLGALGATGLIVLFERRKSRRRFADAVSVWMKQTGEKEGSKWLKYTIIAYVYNGNDTPIPHGVFWGKTDKFGVDHVTSSATNHEQYGVAIVDDVEELIAPHSLKKIYWTYTDEVSRDGYIFQFVDNAGKTWYKSVQDGSIVKKKDLPDDYLRDANFRTARVFSDITKVPFTS